MEIRVRATGAVMYEKEWRKWLQATGGPTFGTLTPEIMEELGVDPVSEGPQASGGDQYQFSMRQGVEQGGDGKWYTKYVLGPIFSDSTDKQGNVTTAAQQEAAYKASKDADRAKAVRAERDKKLKDCDWTQLTDAPGNSPEWANYRQQLRDIPQQTGFPWAVVWPDAPQ